MRSIQPPLVDMVAVRGGNDAAIFAALAACASRWFSMADSHIAFPSCASDVAQQGGTAKAGLLAAAIDLRDLLAQSPNGRQALRDFGFEPVFHYVEGE